MKRRMFLKAAATSAAVGAAGLGAARTLRAAAAEDRKTDRYKAVVPNTLDLAERAALAVNALTGAVDPNRKYETAHCASMYHRPAYFSYKGGAGCHPKVVQVLPMMRIISGSTLRADYDERTTELAVNRVEDDGLWWLKVDEAPWDKALYQRDFHQPTPHNRLLIALLERYQVDGNAHWLDIARRMADGIAKVVRWTGDRAWNGENLTREGKWVWPGPGYDVAKAKEIVTAPDLSNPNTNSAQNIYAVGNNLRGLARWYAVSGDPKARTVADGIARHMMKVFGGKDPDDFPSMIAGREHGFWGGHFHSWTMGMIGMAEYAIATGNQDAARYIRGFYEYARLHGIARMGFFPATVGTLADMHKGCRGWYGPRAGMPCEGCGIGDMVYLATLMSEAGLADYWEDVDQYVRNHLVEHQWVDRSLMKNILLAHAEFTPDPLYQRAGDEVLDCLVGGFSSITDPTWNIGWYTQCCNSNIPQGMYKAWSGILRPQGDGVQVNLLLNRASAWMDIDSYLPYEGKVVLKNKTARSASVRIPRWADRSAVRCKANGGERPNIWLNNYLLIRDLSPNDVITIEFPIVETVERYTEKVYETEYTLRMKGNTVVDISPRGDRPNRIADGMDDGGTFPVNTGYPIYQRDHYKANKAPMKTVERYVAAKLI